MSINREGRTVEECWNYLKDVSISEFGAFRIRPDSDLPWTFYTLTQKIKELEERIKQLERK